MTTQIARGLPALLVSPHLDDAVLSCEAFVGATTPCDALTVFTGTPAPGRYSWDSYCGFTDSDEAMAARLAEDDAAFAGTPHRRHRLGLLDSQYLEGSRASVDAECLEAWASRWAEAIEGPKAVVLPLGAGKQPSGAVGLLKRFVPAWGRNWLRRRRGQLPNQGGGSVANSDHVWVRDVLTTWGKARDDVTLVYYAEIPYPLGADSELLIGRLASETGRRAEPLDVAVEVAAKERRVRCYASQVRHLLGLTTRDGALAIPATERYWLFSPSGAPGHGA